MGLHVTAGMRGSLSGMRLSAYLDECGQLDALGQHAQVCASSLPELN